MMQLKRIFVSLLVAVMMISMAVFAASAADTGAGTFDIAVEATDSEGYLPVTPGGTVAVNIVVTNNPGVSTTSFEVAFDATALEYVSCSFDLYAKDIVNTSKPGMVYIFTDMEADEDVTELGTIVTLNFNVLDTFTGEKAQVTVGNVKAANANGEKIYATGSTGSTDCSHSNVTVISATESTCSVAGTTECKKCATCGKILEGGEELPLAEHTPDIEAATCTSAQTCTVCGEELAAILEHASVVIIEAVEATCANTGLTAGEMCEDCLVVIKKPEVIPAEEHTWTDATCTAPKTCSVCGETEGEALGHAEGPAATCTTAQECTVCDAELVAALGHTVELLDATAPTCTVAGKTAGLACSVCKEVLKAQAEIAALGHTWTDATCTEAKTCSACGATEGEALGHKWVDATCTEAKTCSACDATEGEALGHKWVDATCTEAKTCSACDATEGEALGHTEGATATCTDAQVCTVCDAELVAALGHTVELVDAVPSTCTEAGKTAGLACTVCKEVLKAQADVAVIPHTAGEAVEEKKVAATCTVAGSYDLVIYCTECEAELSRETVAVAALGHTAELVAAVVPTCDEAGKTAGLVCSVCDEVLKAQTDVDALGHVWVDANCTAAKTCAVCGATEGEATAHVEVALPAVPATCTTAGLTAGKMCSVCNVILEAQTSVAATGHKDTTIAGVPATCTTAGLTEGKKCSVCNAITKAQETIAATGHTETTLAGIPATCTTAGLTEGKKCTVCNAITVAQETVEAMGHTEAEIPAVDATCTATGLSAGKKCSVCEAVLEAQKTVAAKAHTEVAIEAVAATCTAAGSTEGKKCSVCGVITVAPAVVQPTGHNLEEIPAVEPTYSEAGSTAGSKCTTCGEIVDATGEIPAKSLAWLWVLIICVVVAGGGATAFYFFFLKKRLAK